MIWEQISFLRYRARYWQWNKKKKLPKMERDKIQGPCILWSHCDTTHFKNFSSLIHTLYRIRRRANNVFYFVSCCFVTCAVINQRYKYMIRSLVTSPNIPQLGWYVSPALYRISQIIAFFCFHIYVTKVNNLINSFGCVGLKSEFSTFSL